MSCLMSVCVPFRFYVYEAILAIIYNHCLCEFFWLQSTATVAEVEALTEVPQTPCLVALGQFIGLSCLIFHVNSRAIFLTDIL